jgi:hypothetical protein
MTTRFFIAYLKKISSGINGLNGVAFPQSLDIGHAFVNMGRFWNRFINFLKSLGFIEMMSIRLPHKQALA